MNQPSPPKPRTQVTAYLHADTKAWLQKYANDRRLDESEVVRLLVEREQQVGWLKWALTAPDPAQGAGGSLPLQGATLPPRWNDPPKRRRGRKPKPKKQ